jgi:methylmalonyl-CoA/ethylmalonyl-CoA epimerase
MVKYVEHIGIAVEDLDKAKDLFASLLGKSPYKDEEVESEQVTTSFFIEEHTKIELLGVMSEESPVSKFLRKRGEGIHHIAFEVDDIFEEMDRLRKAGFQLINEQPKQGADNKLVCFIHPKSAGGVLVELCQDIKEN